MKVVELKRVEPTEPRKSFKETIDEAYGYKEDEKQEEKEEKKGLLQQMVKEIQKHKQEKGLPTLKNITGE